jgi:lysophospholipase L1-like esterase
MKQKRFLCIIVSIIILFFFSACSSFFTRNEADQSGIIDSDNPSIQYIGRFDFSHPKKVVYDWPGVYICAKFEGTSCSLRLNDTTNEYAIIIDNRAPRLLTTDTSKLYRVAAGLPDSLPHTITVRKRTEAVIGKGEFMGFVLDRGKKLLPPEKRPDRRIEFIGNSITCGYGVEGDSANCHFSAKTENANMSYAAITARALNADYFLVAYSGRGVVRNYGDSCTTSRDPMPSLYDRTCYFDSTLIWDFTRWVPQAVVINLGTNDFSTQPYPDKTVFQNAYTHLIQRVRSLYPGVTMFCLSGPMIGEPCTGYVKEVVEQQQKVRRDKDIFFIEIPENRLSDTDWGCDHHPNIMGMSRMVDVIVPAIKLRMNW